MLGFTANAGQEFFSPFDVFGKLCSYTSMSPARGQGQAGWLGFAFHVFG